MKKIEWTRDANSHRREEFRLGIRVERSGDCRSFIKFPENAAGNSFLKVVAERENFATSTFQGHAQVVVGRKEKNELVYPFIELPTLQDQIGAKIDQGSPDFGLELVSLYKQFILKLPQTTCVPVDFFRLLNLADSRIGIPMRCLEFCPYDCIPRNLIYDSIAGWTVLDSEWTFPVPIPIDFLFWRSVHSLVLGLQEAIQRGVNANSKVVLYQGYGTDRIYIPHCWYSLFDFGPAELNKFAFWEQSFARLVLRPELVRRNRLRISKESKLYAALPKPNSFLVRCEGTMKRFMAILK